MRLPAYLSGSGKAMLAWLPTDEVRRRFADRPGHAPAPRKGPRDVDALLKELALARRRGYSVDDEGVREGVYSFGAPVFDASGEAVAGVVGLHQQGAARQRRAAAAIATRRCAVAAELSRRIGGDAAAARGGSRKRRHDATAAAGGDHHPRDARA